MGFEFFDKCYCVHLPNPERRTKIEAQCASVGLHDVRYLHAQPPNDLYSASNFRRNARVEFGISLSHIKAIVHALVDGAQRPLFIEDDIEFQPNAARMLDDALVDLPEAWDLFYLGGHPREPVQWVGSSLVKVGLFSFAEAYAVSRKALLPLLDYWFNRIGQPMAMFDFCVGEFGSKHNGYCCYPVLTSQLPGISSVSGKPEDKRRLVDRGWTINLSGEPRPAAVLS